MYKQVWERLCALGLPLDVRLAQALNINKPPEDLEKVPAPAPGPVVYNLPGRNGFFTGREDVFRRLEEAFASGRAAGLTQVEAISGLGGIGKTQAAIEYAYRQRDRYTHIFWIKAGQDPKPDFAGIAGALGLPQAGEADLDVIVRAVKTWLDAHDNWLVIFDNADPPESVAGYLPSDGKGHILVTSRETVLDVLGIAKPIPLDKLPPEEALAFLQARTRGREPFTKAERDAAEAIAKELGYLPLALEQAGAFILAQECTFEDYLTSYQNMGLPHLERQKPKMGDYPASVATTWAMNFDQVKTASEASADLLYFSAFLDPDAIPLELIVRGAPALGPAIGHALAQVETDPVALDRLLEPVTRYSLVRRDAGTDTYSIHRLVQEVVKDRLDSKARRTWAERTIQALSRAFPDVEFRNWSLCERLLLHARAAARLVFERNIESVEAGYLLHQTACYLCKRGAYAEAEPLYQRGLAISEKALEPDHLNVAATLNDLAELYRAQDRYADGEPLYQRALGIDEKALGPDHPHVATTLNNLALLYAAQGRYADAEPLYQRALRIYEKALGSDHPNVATSLNNLAAQYRAQGRYADAKPLYQRALDIREKALGPDHPDVAQTLNNLALLYAAQGRYANAEPLYRRALGIVEKALGPDHPDVAATLNNLALLYAAQGRYADAEPLYQRASAITEKALGPNHPSIATTLNNLAEVYREQGQYADTEPLYQRALGIYEKALGPNHPSIATTLNNLAEVYREQGRYADAEPLYQRALGICEKALGPNHPSVAIALNNLAALYDVQGRYADAEPLCQRALRIVESGLGSAHPNTATCLENYAAVLRALGREAEAAGFESRAAAIRAQHAAANRPKRSVGRAAREKQG
jgi:tetratricopeptide (TPR) repeat protein